MENKQNPKSDLITDSESFHNQHNSLLKRYRPTGKGKQLWTSASLKINFCSHEEIYSIKNGANDPEDRSGSCGSPTPFETRDYAELPQLHRERDIESTATTHRTPPSPIRGQFQSNIEMPFEGRRTEEEATNSETIHADSDEETVVRTSNQKTPEYAESEWTSSEHSTEDRQVHENFQPKMEVDDGFLTPGVVDLKCNLNPIASTSSKQGSSNKEVWKCPVCPKQYSHERSLNQHRIVKHLDKNDQPKGAQHKKRAVCKICGKKCSTTSHLLQHMYIHEKKSKKKNPNTRTQYDDLPKFECEECGKKYLNPRDRKTHMKIHMDDPEFFCQICEKAFVSQSHFDRHVISHAKNPNFVSRRK